MQSPPPLQPQEETPIRQQDSSHKSRSAAFGGLLDAAPTAACPACWAFGVKNSARLTMEFHLPPYPASQISIMVEPTPFTHVSGYSNRYMEMLDYLKKADDSVSIMTTDDSKSPPTDYKGYSSPPPRPSSPPFPPQMQAVIPFPLSHNLCSEYTPSPCPSLISPPPQVPDLLHPRIPLLPLQPPVPVHGPLIDRRENSIPALLPASIHPSFLLSLLASPRPRSCMMPFHASTPLTLDPGT